MDELIRSFDLQSEEPRVDDAFLRAVSAVVGGEAVLLETWMGAQKVNFDLPDTRVAWTGAGVEWLDREGQFHLNVRIETRAPHTTAQFARDLARQLRSRLLFGDCHLYPFSYFLADAEGAIWHVVLRHTHEDAYDLLPSDPSVAEHFVPALVAAADAELPARVTDGASDLSPPDFCVSFHGPCPKTEQRCPSWRRS